MTACHAELQGLLLTGKWPVDVKCNHTRTINRPRMVNELYCNTTPVKAARQCRTASKGGSLDKTIMYVAELATSVIGKNRSCILREFKQVTFASISQTAGFVILMCALLLDRRCCIDPSTLELPPRACPSMMGDDESHTICITS